MLAQYPGHNVVNPPPLSSRNTLVERSRDGENGPRKTESEQEEDDGTDAGNATKTQ